MQEPCQSITGGVIMARGRKSKSGKRTKSGQLSRAGGGGAPRYDHGTERAQAMQALYGQDGSDAIGRAFKSGLLGEGHEAKALLDTARKVSKAYWRAYEVGPIRCTFGERTSGSAPPDPAKAKATEEWLDLNLKAIDRMDPTRSIRRAFDHLVIDVHPDSGPRWLDRLCWAAKQDKPASTDDLAMLARALTGLSWIV